MKVGAQVRFTKRCKMLFGELLQALSASEILGSLAEKVLRLNRATTTTRKAFWEICLRFLFNASSSLSYDTKR